jgi:hypothetical protein
MFELTFIGLDVRAVIVVGHALNPATGEISNHSMASDPPWCWSGSAGSPRPSRPSTNRVRPGSCWPGTLRCRHQLRRRGVLEAVAGTRGPDQNGPARCPGAG